MASIEEDQKQLDKNATEPNDSDSSSDDGTSSDEEASASASAPVEWLATGRERRSTAGNRLKSMIAAEEPDDELELLFAEDEDDAGFTDVGDDGSDVQMDSSSDEEDGQENADDLEGEKELEKQAREKRQAARKRKAQEAIPMKFRKKVKINTTAATDTGPSTPVASEPRPKKKSERTSWLPSPADMPTRASKRGTTMLSKEQLHRQMIEREVKRLKQVEAMERKAKKMEALKKPPMTQAERLKEAEIIEKKNAKSLNRWEEAEKQREEERRAKLAALNNRTLDGPVVTFWSGVGEWVDGKLRHVGKVVTIEDKPVKKKRASNAAHEQMAESSSNDKDSKPKEPSQEEASVASTQAPLAPATTKPATEAPSPNVDRPAKEPQVANAMDRKSSELPKVDTGKPPEETVASHIGPPAATEKAATEKTTNPQTESFVKTVSPPITGATVQPPLPPLAKPPESKSHELKPPSIRPPLASSMYTTSMFAPPQQTGLMKPPEMKPPTFLAPPAGVATGGLSMPMIGYHSTPSKSSNVLAPPSTAQRQSPLSMPQTSSHPPPAKAPAPAPAPSPAPVPASVPAPSAASVSTPTGAQPSPQPTVQSIQKSSTQKRRQSTTPLSIQKPTQTNAAKQYIPTPPPPPSPPADGKATRNCIILQNFDEDAIKEKANQNRILFNKEMSKLASESHSPFLLLSRLRFLDLTQMYASGDIQSNQEVQNLRQHQDASSRTIRHGTETPKPGFRTITVMPTRRSGSCSVAITSGAV